MSCRCRNLAGLMSLSILSTCSALKRGHLSDVQINESSRTTSLSEEEVPLDVPGLDYCRADLYHSYLTRIHMQAAEDQLRRYRSSRSREQARRKKLLEAEVYARQLLSPSERSHQLLPTVDNERVQFWISYFTGPGRMTLLQWLVRAESAKKSVIPILKKYGLPSELFYVALVESGFSSHAFSSASATGPWQFMAATAQLHGLKINHWVDERRDLAKSTDAASRYLRDLYQQFGDWYLALASYNAGPGKMRRAIRGTGSRDFWRISTTNYIREETKQYVPKILAAIEIGQNLKKYGFVVFEEPGYLRPGASVAVKRAIRLQDVARELGVSVEVLKAWNPELRQDITPPIERRELDASYKLALSPELASVFDAVEPRLPELKISSVKMHRVKSGETLYGLAQRYRVRVQTIRSVNPSLDPQRLRIGRSIAIPIPSVAVIEMPTDRKTSH